MSIYDLEHLPKIVTKCEGIYDVLQAIDPEVIKLRKDLDDLQKELYIKTTDKLIDLWEKDFGIKYDSSLTLQQRREQIIDKLLQKQLLTWDNLKAVVKRFVGDSQVYFINDPAHFKFIIMLYENDNPDLDATIRRLKPAYLTFEIQITGYYKRCGTFNCGTNPL